MKSGDNRELETFPIWEHNFTVSLNPKTFASTVKAANNPTDSALRFSGFEYEAELFIVLATLEQLCIRHLSFNGENLTAEMLMAIGDFVTMVNIDHQQLQSLELSFLTWSHNSPSHNLRVQAFNRLFSLQYCPAVIFRWCYLQAEQFTGLNLGNCRKVTILQIKWSEPFFHDFLLRFIGSKITHLVIGELDVSSQVGRLIAILPQTKIIALRLQVRDKLSHNDVFKLLSIWQLRYLSVSRCPSYENATRHSMERSRCRYIKLNNLKINDRFRELAETNISLCGFDDNKQPPPFLERNLIIQATIWRCAYTLLMIKRFRLQSVFRFVDVNVVKRIVEMVLDTSHELIWLNVIED